MILDILWLLTTVCVLLAFLPVPEPHSLVVERPDRLYRLIRGLALLCVILFAWLLFFALGGTIPWK